MSIYVDTVRDHGWVLMGRPTKSCHMFSSTHDQAELLAFARKLGLKPEWVQIGGQHRVPHFDLTPRKWEAAIKKGAIPVSDEMAVAVWKDYEARQVTKGNELLRQFRRECVGADSKPPEDWYAELSPDEREQVFMALRQLIAGWAVKFDKMSALLRHDYALAFREVVNSINLS